jgi:hypothetical protein
MIDLTTGLKTSIDQLTKRNSEIAERLKEFTTLTAEKSRNDTHISQIKKILKEIEGPVSTAQVTKKTWTGKPKAKEETPKAETTPK